MTIDFVITVTITVNKILNQTLAHWIKDSEFCIHIFPIIVPSNVVIMIVIVIKVK